MAESFSHMTRDDYVAKWVAETKRALVEAFKRGDLSDDAVERIHRRWHRAMPLAQMRAGVAYMRAAVRQPSETGVPHG